MLDKNIALIYLIMLGTTAGHAQVVKSTQNISQV